MSASMMCDHQYVAPFDQRPEARHVSIRHVAPAATVIGDIGFERRDARRDLAADFSHAVDADAAAGIAGLRAHQRRRLGLRPAAAAHIIVRRQQPPRHRQHQRHRQIGDRSRVGGGTVADHDLSLGRFGEIDAVIAGAVTDDRAERRQRVEHLALQPLPAGGDRGAYVGQLLGAESLERRLASAVQKLETLSDPHHQRLRKARSDQDFVRHGFPAGCKNKGRNRLPDSALVRCWFLKD
jgi:hypothetical protein